MFGASSVIVNVVVVVVVVVAETATRSSVRWRRKSVVQRRRHTLPIITSTTITNLMTITLLINKVFNGSLTLRHSWLIIINEELTMGRTVIVALLLLLLDQEVWLGRDTSREGRGVSVGPATGCSSGFKLLKNLIIELVGVGILWVG